MGEFRYLRLFCGTAGTLVPRRNQLTNSIWRSTGEELAKKGIFQQPARAQVRLGAAILNLILQDVSTVLLFTSEKLRVTISADPTAMKTVIEAAAKTDVGVVRTNNEDNFGYDTTAGIFVVCD